MLDYVLEVTDGISHAWKIVDNNIKESSETEKMNMKNKCGSKKGKICRMNDGIAIVMGL
ncbi:9494_t:CDS:2 [Cetraspora pellucida]|uniref:9494_t:CDS:1 n=1 Tax=Cetraspora pellucida TaxID=1433469 RepID=A0A9N9AK20_9GLOM|nr:9494_t:CDS:2 [Cetraspora pellucida]